MFCHFQYSTAVKDFDCCNIRRGQAQLLPTHRPQRLDLAGSVRDDTKFIVHLCTLYQEYSASMRAIPPCLWTVTALTSADQVQVACCFACKPNHLQERRLISSVRNSWTNFLEFESVFSEYILIYAGEIFPFSIFAWMNAGIRSYPCLAALSKNSRKPSGASMSGWLT